MEIERIKSIFQEISLGSFIDHYSTFEKYKDSSSNHEIVEELKKDPNNWSEDSCKTRASKGKQVFKEGLEIDVLRYVISDANPKRLSSDTIKKAQDIYINVQQLSTLKNGLNEKTSKKTYQTILEHELEQIENNNSLSKEEKRALVKIRLGQSDYRKELIDLWDGCAVTGCKNLTVLIASHIKPYRECEGEEKFDKFNGLLLSANYDKLFDSFLISFDENGQILISKKLSDNDLNSLNIKKTDRLINIYPENHKYLEEHRAKLINP